MGTMGRLRGVKVARAWAWPSTPAMTTVSGVLWFHEGTPLRRVSRAANSGSAGDGLALAFVGELPGLEADWLDAAPHPVRMMAANAIVRSRVPMPLKREAEGNVTTRQMLIEGWP